MDWLDLPVVNYVGDILPKNKYCAHTYLLGVCLPLDSLSVHAVSQTTFLKDAFLWLSAPVSCRCLFHSSWPVCSLY